MTDLHIHSSFSDGTDSIDEIIKVIKAKKVKYFSITDHNNFDSIDAIKKLSIKHELNYLPGIEISVTYNNKEYHVLAYGKNIVSDEINKICKDLKQLRIASDNMFISKVIGNEHINEYLQYQNENSRGGWKALNFLLDKGYISNKKEFFELFDKHGVEPDFIDPIQLLNVLNSHNLVAILAHPTLYQVDNKMPCNELELWKKWGISGIEVYTQYYNDPETIKYYEDFCSQNDLIITGGSDYHGSFNNIRIGDIEFKNHSCLDVLKNEFIKI